MSKFKKGDDVEVINWGEHYDSNSDAARELKLSKWQQGGGYYGDEEFSRGGKFGKVMGVDNDGKVGVRIEGRDHVIGQDGLRLLKANEETHNTMSIREKFALLLKGEPEKSFTKSGITDSSDNLTEEGHDIFLAWLLKKNGEAFKKEVVDELLKKEKKEE